jgi:hypothetical protein
MLFVPLQLHLVGPDDGDEFFPLEEVTSMIAAKENRAIPLVIRNERRFAMGATSIVLHGV